MMEKPKPKVKKLAGEEKGASAPLGARTYGVLRAAAFVLALAMALAVNLRPDLIDSVLLRSITSVPSLRPLFSQKAGAPTSSSSASVMTGDDDDDDLLDNPSVQFNQYSPSSTSVAAPTRATDRAPKDCLILDGVYQTCSDVESYWAESLAHPAILMHPHPRSVLVVGPLGAPVVAEALRHYLLTEVVWVTDVAAGGNTDNSRAAAALKYMGFGDGAEDEGEDKDDDLSVVRNRGSAYPAAAGSNATSFFRYEEMVDWLGRSHVVRQRAADFFASDEASELRGRFDVILVDHIAADSALAAHLRPLMQKDGVLASAARHSDFNLARALNKAFDHVHVGLQSVEKLGSAFHMYYASSSENIPIPGSISSTLVDRLIARRVTNGQDDLEHYDGETHVGLFAVPKRQREEYRREFGEAPATRKGKPTRRFVDGAVRAPPVRAETFLHEYIGCRATDLLHSTDKLRAAIEKGLEFAHATVVTLYSQNPAATSPLSSSVDDDDEEDAPRPSASFTAILANGHVFVQVFADSGYVTADYTAHPDGESMPDELLDYLSEVLNAERVTGSQVDRGTHARAQATVDTWDVTTRSVSSTKLEVRASGATGKGVYAREDIEAGEVIIEGPLEPDLVHDTDVRGKPEWYREYVERMSQNVEEDVWAVPLASDAMRYLNHRCDPNTWYAGGGYDRLVARRRIRAGEEVTFDYATVDADPGEPVLPVCKCGESKPGGICRGKVTGDDWRLPQVQAYGLDHFWPHVQRLIIQERIGEEVDDD